jgi:hypothetical protein
VSATILQFNPQHERPQESQNPGQAIEILLDRRAKSHIIQQYYLYQIGYAAVKKNRRAKRLCRLLAVDVLIPGVRVSLLSYLASVLSFSA